MKKCFCILASLIVLSAFADREAFQKKFLAATGGRIAMPGSQQGGLVIANAQNAAKTEWLVEAAQYIQGSLNYKTEVRKGEFSIKTAKIPGSMAIYVIDDPAMPMTMCANEEFWGVVNVAALKSEKEPFFRARVKKAISRVFALLGGASASRYNGTLLQAMTKAEDLDTVVDNRLPADVIARCSPYLRAVGISPELVVTYIVACRQGWAPAPTNEYQRAIWDKVRAVPKNPIKIEFDPKKGR